MMRCEECGETEGTLDLHPESLWPAVLLCEGCYEERARSDETLLPLHKHPDYNPGGLP